MSASLNIINNLDMSSQGLTTQCKQGSSTDAFSTPFTLTIDGAKHHVQATLATATAVTVYDDDDDTPVDFDYLFLWADQDCYIQIVGSATAAVLKVKAKVPFTLGFNKVLGAAATTAITGGAEPSVTDIDSIILGNYSGSTLNYVFAIFD